MNPSSLEIEDRAPMWAPTLFLGASENGNLRRMRCVVVIPARMASTRFPGKPLVDLLGKPMVQWVYESAKQVALAEDVVIATPDPEILAVAKAFGAHAIRTRDDHPSGTDRLAEVAERIQADVYVNVQGDEPLIHPSTIESVANALLNSDDADMSSAFSICTETDVDNPAAVKVVTALNGDALYFSRHAIPFLRHSRVAALKKHIGIYAFRENVLKAFAKWSPTPLEQAESLEQLRFLEHGVRIRMVETPASETAIDTPEQADEVRRILVQRSKF